MTPRVSILLPVRDAEATLDLALESLARQTLADWECIVIDDGSRDASRSIAEDRARRDRRFRIERGPRQGVVAALNRGLTRCRAPLVARMDADDWCHRARLAEQAALLDATPGLEAVGCFPRLFPRATLSEGMRAYERWLHSLTTPESIWRERFVECPIAHPTLMIRRGTLAALGYRDRGWAEDWDLLLRLLRRGPVVGVVARRRVGWREHPRRTSRRDPRLSLDRFADCRAWHLHRDFLRDHPRYVLWGHGPTGRALRRRLEALGHAPSAIVEVHPRRIGQTIRGVPVVGVDRLADAGSPDPVVVSVAGSGPRGEIRAALDAMGHVEGEGYVFAA